MVKQKRSNCWQDRYNYRNSLAIQWLRLHRPDIVAVIIEEVLAKFPETTHRTNEKFELPDRLRNTK